MSRVEQTLQEMLLLARRGEITAVAVATCGTDLSTGSSFTLGDGTLAELLGSICLMQHRIMTAAESGPLD